MMSSNFAQLPQWVRLMDEEAFLEQIKKTVCQYGLVKQGDGVVIGVSGGADSVCLLKVFLELRKEYGLRLTAVHVNHCLRGREADEDEAFVKKLCELSDVSLKTFRVDVKAVCGERGISLEEAGRMVRYDLFNKVMAEVEGSCIAVAHHKDDQAETIMMNILRGAGLDGLAGMDFKSGNIIRPLLGVARAQIVDFLERLGMPYRTDSSNNSLEFARNRVRNKLFPLIKEDFSVNPVSCLLRLSEHAREDGELLDELANKAFEKHLVLEKQGYVRLNAKGLAKEHKSLIKRIIRICWKRLKGSARNLESIHVESILNMLTKGSTGKRVCLPQGFQAEMAYDSIVFSEIKPPEEKQFDYRVNLNGETEAADAGGILTVRVMPADEAFKAFGDPVKIKESALTQLFDFERLQSGINIRNRRKGDRIRPCRLGGEKKLKEFFIDQKIAKEVRDRIPLVAQGNAIVWIIGMRTNEGYKARKDTKSVAVLSWRNIEE